MVLTEREKNFWDENGYLVREGVFSEAQCNEIIAHMEGCVRRVTEEKLAAGTFYNDFWDQLPPSQHTMDVFYVSKFKDPTKVPPEEWHKQVLRVGHGLHAVDPFMLKVVCNPTTAQIASGLLGAPALAPQSMVIYKPPHDKNTGFHYHQAASYMHTIPNDVMFVFTALEPADQANGCLRVVPGTHKGPVHIKYDLYRGRPFEETRVLEGEPDTSNVVHLEVGPGTAIFCHGRCYHGSARNKSGNRWRRALLTHIASSKAEWLDSNWIKPPPGGFIKMLEPGV